MKFKAEIGKKFLVCYYAFLQLSLSMVIEVAFKCIKKSHSGKIGALMLITLAGAASFSFLV